MKSTGKVQMQLAFETIVLVCINELVSIWAFFSHLQELLYILKKCQVSEWLIELAE